MVGIEGNIGLTIVAFVLGIGVFGGSLWVVLPKESSPFRYGTWRGLGICAGFQLVLLILNTILISLLGLYGLLAAGVLFFIGMNRIFEADFRYALMIIGVNYALAKLVQIAILKLFVLSN